MQQIAAKGEEEQVPSAAQLERDQLSESKSQRARQRQSQTERQRDRGGRGARSLPGKVAPEAEKPRGWSAWPRLAARPGGIPGLPIPASPPEAGVPHSTYSRSALVSRLLRDLQAALRGAILAQPGSEKAAPCSPELAPQGPARPAEPNAPPAQPAVPAGTPSLAPRDRI